LFNYSALALLPLARQYTAEPLYQCYSNPAKISFRRGSLLLRRMMENDVGLWMLDFGLKKIKSHRDIMMLDVGFWME